MKKIALMIVATAFLAACGKSAEEVHTVDWFKQAENKAVLEDTVKACKNDPGTLGKTPNCINAEEAQSQLNSEAISQAVWESYQKK